MDGPADVVVAFSNVQVEVSKRSIPRVWEKETKTLLAGVSGLVRRGEVCFVMGPSGSGKTTLLDALCDRTPRGSSRGSLYVRRSHLCCKYVPNDPEFSAALTVLQTMDFAAAHYVKHQTQEKKNSLVQSLLQSLGLWERRSSRVGDGRLIRGLSGGERRRLAVAVEMLSQPEVLLLDEPTTGLDASAAFLLVRLLRQVARETGTAVVLSIHQPSQLLYDLADSLLLLAPRGRQMYFGPAPNVESYVLGVLGLSRVPSENLADWLLRVAASHEADACIEQFGTSQWGEELRSNVERLMTVRSSSSKKNDDDNDDSRVWRLQRKSDENENDDLALEQGHLGNAKVEDSFRGWLALMRRQVQTSLLDVRMWGLRVVVWLLIVVFSATIWVQLGQSASKIPSYVGYLVGVLGFECLVGIAAIPFRMLEREVYVRERANAMYSVVAFSSVQTISDIVVLFLWSLLSTVVYFYTVGLSSEGAWRFFSFATVLFLTLLCWESLMIFIVAVVPNLVAALGLAVVFFGLYLAVCGFFIPFSLLGWWYKWIRFINPIAFGFAGNLITNFQNTTWLPYCAPSGYPCYVLPVPGDAVLLDLDIDTRLWVNMIALVFYFIVVRTMATIALYIFASPRK